MFQVIDKNKYIYTKEDGKLLSGSDINSNSESLFTYNNVLCGGKSNYYAYDGGMITFNTTPYTLFSIDTNGSTVFDMQVISYQTSQNNSNSVNVTYSLYIDNELFDEVTLYPKQNDVKLLMFYRVYKIYKPCNNIKLVMKSNIEHKINIERTQVCFYTMLQ